MELNWKGNRPVARRLPTQYNVLNADLHPGFATTSGKSSLSSVHSVSHRVFY